MRQAHEVSWRRALGWLRGFGGRIAAVLVLALLLATATAAAPLAVMRLVDTLTHIAGAATVPPGAGGAVLPAPSPVPPAELAQVGLSKLLESRSWRVRLAMDFALRTRVTQRLHELP